MLIESVLHAIQTKRFATVENVQFSWPSMTQTSVLYFQLSFLGCPRQIQKMAFNRGEV